MGVLAVWTHLFLETFIPEPLVVVVVVITRHGGVATFAEAASNLQSQDTETQGTFQVEKEWYQSGKVAEAMEGTIV